MPVNSQVHGCCGADTSYFHDTSDITAESVKQAEDAARRSDRGVVTAYLVYQQHLRAKPHMQKNGWVCMAKFVNPRTGNTIYMWSKFLSAGYVVLPDGLPGAAA